MEILQIPFADSLPSYQPCFVQSIRQEVGTVFETLPSLQKEKSETVQPLFSASVEYRPEANHRTGQEPAIFILPLLFCLCFIALNRLYLLFSKNSQAGERLVSSVFCQNGINLRKPIFWWNLFMALLSGSTCCIWVMLSTYGYISNTWKSMGFLFASITGYLLLKWLLFYLSSLLIDLAQPTNDYLRKKVVTYYNILLGVLPLAFVQFFYHCLPMWLMVAVMLAGLGWMSVRGFFIFYPKIKSYGFFLYFCTLEILPVALLVKVLLKL